VALRHADQQTPDFLRRSLAPGCAFDLTHYAGVTWSSRQDVIVK
jgi:hypothetical protein